MHQIQMKPNLTRIIIAAVILYYCDHNTVKPASRDQLSGELAKALKGIGRSCYCELNPHSAGHRAKWRRTTQTSGPNFSANELLNRPGPTVAGVKRRGHDRRHSPLSKLFPSRKRKRRRRSCMYPCLCLNLGFPFSLK